MNWKIFRTMYFCANFGDILLIGKIFSQYEIIEQIGQGGMGAVYRARDNNLNRDVAIKVITVAMQNEA